MNDLDPQQKAARRKKMAKDFAIALTLFLLGYYTFN